MGVITTNLSPQYELAIIAGIPNKWQSKYHFLQLAAKEKLIKEGLISDETSQFIHYHCIFCNRDIYISPEMAGMYEWIYCSVCGKKDKKDAMERKEITLGKYIPAGAEIKK
jgi:hypothetical protein